MWSRYYDTLAPKKSKKNGFRFFHANWEILNQKEEGVRFEFEISNFYHVNLTSFCNFFPYPPPTAEQILKWKPLSSPLQLQICKFFFVPRQNDPKINWGLPITFKIFLWAPPRWSSRWVAVISLLTLQVDGGGELIIFESSRFFVKQLNFKS